MDGLVNFFEYTILDLEIPVTTGQIHTIDFDLTCFDLWPQTVTNVIGPSHL